MGSQPFRERVYSLKNPLWNQTHDLATRKQELQVCTSEQNRLANSTLGTTKRGACHRAKKSELLLPQQLKSINSKNKNKKIDSFHLFKFIPDKIYFSKTIFSSVHRPGLVISKNVCFFSQFF